MNNNISIIKHARSILSDSTRWTTGAAARDKHGKCVKSNSPTAAAWCAIGSVRKVCGPNDPSYSAAVEELSKVARTLYHKDIVGVNDSLGYDATIRVFDETIDALAKVS